MNLGDLIDTPLDAWTEEEVNGDDEDAMAHPEWCKVRRAEARDWAPCLWALLLW